MASNNPLAPLGAAQAALGQQQGTQNAVTGGYYSAQTIATITGNVYYYSYQFTAGTTVAADWYQTMYGNQIQYVQMPQISYVDEETLRAQRELQQAYLEEQQVRQSEATNKATELLLACLSSEQRAMWDEYRMFIVEGSQGNRYRLGLTNPPARLLDDNTAEFSYCIHTHGIPREDELLGFKLLLEANEDLFLSTANATRLRDSSATPATVLRQIRERQEIAA